MWYNPTLTRISAIKARSLPKRCIKDDPRENSLQLYLRFNEGNGRIVFDYSKYKRHGIIYNTNWGKNSVDRGLWFNGINSYVQTPSFALTGTAISILDWVNFRTQSFTQTLLNKNYRNGPLGYLWLYRVAATEGLTFEYATASTWASKAADSFFSGYNDRYVFVSVTCDYQNKILKFYRNGQIHTTYDITDTMIFPSANTVCYIGSYQGSQLFFKGVIDDVGLYNRMLTDQEIRMIYENEKDNYR